DASALPGSSRDRIVDILGAVAPVLLAGAIAVEPAQRTAQLAQTAQGVKSIIASFPPAVRDEVLELFRLLDIRVARRVLTGISDDWHNADPREVGEFLERWRHSPFALLQSGYFALHDLVLGAWYAGDSNWGPLAYPGPPNVE
ncbi:MAG: hypothetical protein ABI831_26795, partial [Betaproteobacteria bacterium]